MLLDLPRYSNPSLDLWTLRGEVFAKGRSAHHRAGPRPDCSRTTNIAALAGRMRKKASADSGT